MKKTVCCLLTVVILIFTVSCTDATLYHLDDFIPPLMDSQTQLPYVTEIQVRELATGNEVTLTEGVEHNRIRMHFEELECLRTKVSEAEIPHDVGYEVCFVTTAETVAVILPVTEGNYMTSVAYIGDYEFTIFRNGVDTAYFASLFGE